jgi:hypothetical protein
MPVFFPDDALGDLADVWRVKYDEAYRRYSEYPTAKNLAECLKTLQTLADLVIRNQPPAE